MLDAASSADVAAAAGSSSSISPSATYPAAVFTVPTAASETTTCPPLSVDVNVTATAVTITTAADVANDARYDPAVNVNGSPLPLLLWMMQTTGGQ